MAPSYLRFTHQGLEFLTAIHGCPRDDVIRLVFADWLDEHEHSEYAQMIRLGLRAENAEKQSPEEKAQFSRLDRKLRREYVSPMPKKTRFIGWNRGLPCLAPTLKALSAHTLEAFAEGCKPRMSKLYAFSLRLFYYSTSDVLQCLKHPFMDQVHDLHLWRQPDTTLEDVEAIAKTGVLDRLESIHIHSVAHGNGNRALSILSGGPVVDLVERTAEGRGGYVMSTSDAPSA
jgi:uncharacterized protein (TIGR02996 family)